MSDLFRETLPVSLATQLAEVEREIMLRRRVYPRFIKSGQLSPAAADRQISIMEAVADTLRRLA